MLVHEKKCSASKKLDFSGSGYGQKKDFSDLMIEHQITVQREDRFFPYRIAFDFECLFESFDS